MPSLKFQAIRPKALPDSKEYLDAFEKGAQKAAALVLSDLQATTKTWKHKPTFDVTITRDKGDYIIAAGTDDKIYGFVDAGTKAHIIRPKRSKYLRFQSGYRAKTRVGIIGSIEGGAFGNDVYTNTFVLHPGFPGRKFTITILKRRQKTAEQEISQNVAKVVRKAQE